MWRRGGSLPAEQGVAPPPWRLARRLARSLALARLHAAVSPAFHAAGAPVHAAGSRRLFAPPLGH
eukprot:7204153-Prymnesium_polylepis.1